MMKKIRNLLKSSIFIFLYFAGMLLPAQAADKNSFLDKPEWAFDAYIQSEYAYQTEGSNKWFKCRNVLNLELSCDFSPSWKAFVQTRFVYDAAFDFGDRGITGRKNMADNFSDDRAWYDYEPIIREGWIEFSSAKFEARIGKQLVTWGTADGFRLMDVVHTFNYRELLKPNDEDFKIPREIVNLNFYFTPDSSVQVLIIPRFIESFNPPVGHPWSFNVSRAIADFIGAMAPLGVRFDYDMPSTRWKDFTYGVRWRSRIERLNLDYTLNWLYTWDEFSVMVPNGPPIPGIGLPSAWKFRHDRLQLFGGTFSYSIPGFGSEKILQGSILRGEIAYTKSDDFTNIFFQVEEKDHLDFLFGFDKYFPLKIGPDNSEWWFSTQLKWTYLMDEGKFNYLGAGLDQLDKWQMGYSLLIATDWWGEKLKLSWLSVGFDDGGLRSWPKFIWEFSDNLRVNVGYYYIRGPRTDLLGEFNDNDSIEVLWKYSF